MDQNDKFLDWCFFPAFQKIASTFSCLTLQSCCRLVMNCPKQIVRPKPPQLGPNGSSTIIPRQSLSNVHVGNFAPLAEQILCHCITGYAGSL